MACEVGRDQRKRPWEGRAKRLRGWRGWGGVWIVDEVRKGMGVSDAAAFKLLPGLWLLLLNDRGNFWRIWEQETVSYAFFPPHVCTFKETVTSFREKEIKLTW